MNGFRASRAFGVAGLAAAALLVSAVPASAAPVGDYGALQTAFADPSSVSGVATLTADISQGTATGLTLSAGNALTVDLNGSDLTTSGIVLGTGSALTITDTGTGPPGQLIASSSTTAGIQTTGASLIIEGRARVDARATKNVTAGIGGSAKYGSGGTVVIRGDAVVNATGAQFAAAIGGGDNGDGGDVTIGGNATVTATGMDGAGIGGGDYSDGGTLHVTDNADVTATSRNGAGIGGGYYGGNGGTVTIDGSASVTATSTGRGAGIGGGQANITKPEPVGGNGGTVTIGGTATVIATGAPSAAGIGGGIRGSGGSVTINGGAVTAINGKEPTTSAVGQGSSGASFGSLSVNAPGTLVIPNPAVLRVPAGVTVTGDGYLRGGGTPGTIVNNGAIQQPTPNVDWAALGVLPNNFLVAFDANGGDISSSARAATTEVRVFATSFEAGARTPPPAPTRSHHTFLGWNTSRDGSGESIAFGLDTVLSGDLTLYAQWSATATPTATPTAPPGEPGGPGHPSGGDTSANVDELAATGTAHPRHLALAGTSLLVAGMTLFRAARRRHRR